MKIIIIDDIFLILVMDIWKYGDWVIEILYIVFLDDGM